MSQLNMFEPDPTVNYHGSNPESNAAHRSIQGDKQRLRAAVVRYVAGQGPAGATSDEVEAATGMSHQTVSARCTEAKALGLLVDSGLRRRTRSGRNAAVLITFEQHLALTTAH